MADLGHELKTWPKQWDAVADGRKTFDVRKNDRHFAVGDTLRLRRWCPYLREYLGGCLTARVSYIVRGPDFGVREGYCVMSLADVQEEQADD